MDVAGRLERLRHRFDDAGVDALLVTSLTNVRYLTGFTGSAALLLVRADAVTFVSDGRYRDQATDQLGAAGVEARIEITASDHEKVLGTAAHGVGRLGLEADHVTWGQQRRYDQSWFPTTELVATERLVEDLRLVKDPGELDRMEAAATIADEALAHVLPMLVDGRTEAEIALELETEMRRRGASGPSFESIVASGPNGAKPHARPGPRPVGRHELVVMDFGAVVDGYCSDMTRTFTVGEPAGDVAPRMLEVVADSQRAGVAAVRSGVTARQVDRACREIIEAAGWGEAFLHSTGHGVGLDIHEAPRVSAQGDAVLTSGEVVTVEPGVYLPEVGGVRIEDTVVVTDDGCRPLTRAPKEPLLT
jgi:Xaa-Pro aminopeptidase